MGAFQNNPTATKEDVWSNVRTAGDYPDRESIMGSGKPGEAHGDYVFGRMMKLRLAWGSDSVEVPEAEYDKPTPDYQSWCRKYPTRMALVEAAIDSLKKVKTA